MARAVGAESALVLARARSPELRGAGEAASRRSARSATRAVPAERALPAAVGFRRARLRGTHLTPLALDPAAGPLPLREGGPLDALGALLLADFDALVGAIDTHFAEVVAPAAARAAARAAPPGAAPAAAGGAEVPAEATAAPAEGARV